jgi:hypothetical protein
VATGECGAAVGARVTLTSMVVATAARTSIASRLLAQVYLDFSRGEWPLVGMLSPPCHWHAGPT